MKKYTLNTPMPVIVDGTRKVLPVGTTISLDEKDIETRQMLACVAIAPQIAPDDDEDDGDKKSSAAKTPAKK